MAFSTQICRHSLFQVHDGRASPVGINLYIASGIAKMGISEITVAVLPRLLGKNLKYLDTLRQIISW
jgi:hypothetical protein